MELSGEMWSAIVGAFVGGAISFGLQTISTRAAQRERRAAKRQADLAKANALIIKVIRITSDLVNYNNHVKEQRAGARQRGLLPDKWASLLPLANHPLPVAFSTEEMALLLELKEDELFNRVIILDQLHSSTIAIWVLYGDKRAALQDLPSQFESDGPIGTVRLEGVELQRWLPRIVEVESLAQQLIVRTERDAEEATAVMNDLGKVLQERGASSIKLQVAPTDPST